MNLLTLLWRTSKWLCPLAFGLSILGGVSSAALIVLVQVAISRQSHLRDAIAVAFACTALLILVSRVASQVLLVYLSQRATLSLVDQVSRSIMHSPLRRLEELGSHRLNAILTDEMNAITLGLVSIPTSALAVTILIVLLGYLAWLYAAGLVLVLATLVIGALSFRFTLGRADAFLARARLNRDELFDSFRGLVYGVKELQLNSRRRTEFAGDVMYPQAASVRRNDLLASAVHALTGAWGLFLLYTLFGFVVFVLPAMGIDQRVITGFVLALLFIVVPIESIVMLLPNIRRGSFALTKLAQTGLLDEASSFTDTKDTVRSIGSLGRVILSLRDVTYAYNDDDGGFRVGPINIDIAGGEIVFVMGGNGSGKTTLGKIVTGLYRPAEGRIELHGQAIQAGNLSWYRDHFSAVFSDFFLFKSLVGLDPNIVTREGDLHLRRLRLNDKVSITNHSFSSVELSQGQRRRLALACALLEDRDIYLFDEVAADQDTRSRASFYDEILPSLKERGKAVIVITHDEDRRDVADRLIKMQGGQIVADDCMQLALASERSQRVGGHDAKWR
jgi:putative ATP-binding cassette transporter